MRRPVFGSAAGIGFALLLSLRPAFAHDPFQITTDARLRATRLDLHVVMMDATAAKLCLPEGARGSKLDSARFAIVTPLLESCGRALYRITVRGETVVPRAVRARLSVENDVELDIEYPRPPSVGWLRIDATHLRRLPDPTYGAELTVTGEGTFLGQALLRADQSVLEIPIEPAGIAGEHLPAPVPPSPSFLEYLRLGIGHILTGTDHLLFLAVLLVICRRFRSVLTIVTCFTVAHSITLALATWDVVVLPARVVEPLIAATIVFVAAENLLRSDDPKGRWALTFAFGLLHGFGFASALKQAGLGAAGAPLLLPLFSFNLGVELGQIAVAGLMLPVLWMLRRTTWFARAGTRGVSAVVGLIGIYWLLQRTILASVI